MNQEKIFQNCMCLKYFLVVQAMVSGIDDIHLCNNRDNKTAHDVKRELFCLKMKCLCKIQRDQKNNENSYGNSKDITESNKVIHLTETHRTKTLICHK